jgi:pimeloyl-ACP methyl ester carboxylesterase
MRSLSWLLLAASLASMTGCGDSNGDYLTEDRKAKGLVVILPGIEGESPLNHDIRLGLVQGGADCAMPIYSWGRPVPGLGVLLNQVDFIGNRLAGIRIANMIAQYQDAYPDRPVYVVGHSGGGGVAVFTAEAMADLPGDRKIDGLVLLSASISAGYDLSKAAGRCKSGIVNFYNKGDVGLLGVGTIVAGNVDGGHGPSAGFIGFDKIRPSDPDKKKEAFTKVYQVVVTEDMSSGDPHASTTRPGFVSQFVARWVTSQSWPAGTAEVAYQAEQ